MNHEKSDISYRLFEELPPLEKNQVLKKFYRNTFTELSFSSFFDDASNSLLLPLTEGDGELANSKRQIEVDKRCAWIDKSPLKEILTTELKTLLKSSGITNGMKEFIVWEFEANLFSLSFIDGNKVELPVWLDMCGHGIYSEEKNTLQKIEEQSYKDFSVDVIALVMEPSDTPPFVEAFVQEKFGYKFGMSERALAASIHRKWRNDFTENYGRES